MGVSVLTLVKNRPLHLQRLIEGLERSDVVPDELVVVDMAENWSPPPVRSFPIHRVGMKSDRLPLAAARNAAAQAASHADLLFLDVDCIPMRSLVGAAAETLKQVDGLICAEVRYLKASACDDGWTEEQLRAVSRRHPVRNFPPRGWREESNPGLFWSLLFAVKHSRFIELRGFDEAFSGYGAEDTDFGFRARAHDIPLVFLGETGAFHQCHDVFDPPLQHLDDIVRNAIVFHSKWRTWPMSGWLDQFAAAGLIRMSADSIAILRPVTDEEFAAAKVDGPF